jgi:IstB-like ATP binding protein
MSTTLAKDSDMAKSTSLRLLAGHSVASRPLGLTPAKERDPSAPLARYGRVDLLCIDELGYMELDRRGAELLFQVLTEREEKNSIAIASKSPSLGGRKPSPTPASAQRSSTGSPSTGPSSKQAPTPTASLILLLSKDSARPAPRQMRGGYLPLRGAVAW